MKKLFIVLAVASLGFVACNNSASDAEDAAKKTADSIHLADSLKKVADDAAAAAAAAANDTTHKMGGDTSKMAPKK